IIIVAGALVYHYKVEKVTMEPSMVSKLNTFTQILLVFAVMFSSGIQALPDTWIAALLYAVVVTTVWSGLGYMWTWGGRALGRQSS
ncbi:MAG: CDP-alcohol phosphatidyltransferase family protein, partial [Gammaproteobacteria bacterium]|nr:CDP-alcohol phosphatidyltransferase family protein [Gammaproteobacteria bacterium]